MRLNLQITNYYRQVMESEDLMRNTYLELINILEPLKIRINCRFWHTYNL